MCFVGSSARFPTKNYRFFIKKVPTKYIVPKISPTLYTFPNPTKEVVSRPECADPIDFSFLFLASLDDAKDSTPRDSKNLKHNVDTGLYRTTAIKVIFNQKFLKFQIFF